jgi:hypothetical protein
LFDAFRVVAPDKKEFTFTSIQSHNSTRLDRFYISRMDRSSVREVEHLPIIWTDHKAVVMKLDVKGRDMGKGYWKCNVSTLADDFFVADLKELCTGFLSDGDGRFSPELWEDFKSRVKRLNVIHSQRLAANRRADLESLENKLKILTVKEEILKCTAEIKETSFV